MAGQCSGYCVFAGGTAYDSKPSSPNSEPMNSPIPSVAHRGEGHSQRDEFCASGPYYSHFYLLIYGRIVRG